MTRRIASGAYQALRDALGTIYWYKRPFRNFLRTALRDSPELLAGLDFGEPKRVVADQLVDRLITHESRYRDLTLELMLEVAGLQSFPDLDHADDPDERRWLAERAVEDLRQWTEQYSDVVADRDKRAAEREARRNQAETARRFADDVDTLRTKFLAMHRRTDARQRWLRLPALPR